MGNDKVTKKDSRSGSFTNPNEKKEQAATQERKGSSSNSEEKRGSVEAISGSKRNSQENREILEGLEQGLSLQNKEYEESASNTTSDNRDNLYQEGPSLDHKSSARSSPARGSSPSRGNSKGSSRNSPEPDSDPDRHHHHHKDIKTILQKSWKKHFSRDNGVKLPIASEESTIPFAMAGQELELVPEPEVIPQPTEPAVENAPKEVKPRSKVPKSRSRSRSPSPGPDTPSRSWAFTAKASTVPSKFDHIGALKTAFSTHKENNGAKEGIPLTMLPEVLEAARFMVPPPRELVPLLQRIDVLYRVGDIVQWPLLQNLAFQIERREARYPSVFNTRIATGRMTGISPSGPNRRPNRSPSRRTHPEDDRPEMEPEVYEMMKEIDNNRKKFVSEGNYLAAKDAATCLMELKIFEDNKRRSIMTERHIQEREQVERAYKDDLDERNQLWDERLKSFQKEVVEHAKRLKQQHVVALEQFKEKLNSKQGIKPQWSRELLQQRRVQACLGKQGKYLEAQDVKENADRMEQIELQAAVSSRQTELISKEQGYRLKQQAEMDILLQRAARTREEIRKSRASDLQRIHQRHKNVIQELTAAQKQELYRFDQLMKKKAKHQYAGRGNRHRSTSSRYAQGYDYSSDSCASEDNAP